MPAIDTIFALSSGGLPSGVAVVRVSGPRAFDVCRDLVGDLPSPRQATLRTVHDKTGALIDQGLVLTFPSPHSFTGEDCVEFQIHGGRAVVNALLKAMGELPGCRMAEAGEFSRRAFENGKLDLVEIEGLADLLVAETAMQHRLASEQSRGELSRLYMGWRDRLLHARAMIEAEFDFADEDDIPGQVSDRIWIDMAALVSDMEHHLAGFARGEIIRDGFRVVIAGAPNAGKSSLLNYLAGRDVAIVTEHAGTTRDVLSLDLDVDGYLVRLYDTAGLREAADVVEREGIRRARQHLSDAHLVLHLTVIGEPILPLENVSATIRNIGTKLDISVDGTDAFDLAISTATGEGMDKLWMLLGQAVKAHLGEQSVSVPSRLRHKEHLACCLDALREAVDESGTPLEVRAESLRRSADWLGRLTGRIDTEMLLGAIFSEFCVGK